MSVTQEITDPCRYSTFALDFSSLKPRYFTTPKIGKCFPLDHTVPLTSYLISWLTLLIQKLAVVSGISWTSFHLLKKQTKPQTKKPKPNKKLHDTAFASKSCCMNSGKKNLPKMKNNCKLAYILYGKVFNQRSYGTLISGNIWTLHSGFTCNQVNWRSK